MKKRIAVVGVGNLLMGDDGIGIHTVEALRKEKLPSGVKVFDCATRAFEVLECIDGCDKAVIIDAYKNNGNPGSIYRLWFEPGMYGSINLCMHDINFVDALKAGNEVYNMPSEIVIIGIEPEEFACSLVLSLTLREVLPEVIKAVISEL